jgi:hypothetical protein
MAAEAVNAALVARVRLLEQQLAEKDAQLDTLDEEVDHQRKRAKQCSCHVLTTPLESEEILDKVFSYVGAGDYIFAAGVCRKWRGRYVKLCYNTAADEPDKLRTTYRSSVATMRRLTLALSCGMTLSVNAKHLARTVAECPDPIGVLTALRLQGLQWSTLLCSAAAWCDNLQLLQWLSEHGCPWQLETLLNDAARRGSVALVQWLYQNADEQCSRAPKTMLYCAGAAGNLAVADWLQQQAAP